MNTIKLGRFFKPLFPHVELAMLLVSLSILVVTVNGQTITIQHTFTNSPDGARPSGGLILSGSVLYGKTQQGGSAGTGMIFSFNMGGIILTNLHSFSASPGYPPTNSDGIYPSGLLVISGNRLYGTAIFGGTSGNGTVFSLNTDGTGFTVLHSFSATSSSNPTNSDGSDPQELTISSNTLYGITSEGGITGYGTVFALNTDGTGFTNLYYFRGGNDGQTPQALCIAGNTLYGTTGQGGRWTDGTVFRINTDGTAYTNLYTFSVDYTTGNGDGSFPLGLTVSGNILYGVAEQGGSANDGTVFCMDIGGRGFTNLHSFTGANDGSRPLASLVMVGNTLYGTASAGGSANNGTVFGINTDGTGFTNLYNFPATSGTKSTNSVGSQPTASLVLANNSLYGLASTAGALGYGTIFELLLPPSPPPVLTISAAAGANVILTWPNNGTQFNLEFKTNLSPSVAWATNLTVPAITNGHNIVINSIIGGQMYYRLTSQ